MELEDAGGNVTTLEGEVRRALAGNRVARRNSSGGHLRGNPAVMATIAEPAADLSFWRPSPSQRPNGKMLRALAR